MLFKWLVTLTVFLKTVAAGGSESCDATYQLTLPIFTQFNANLSLTQQDCIEKVDGYQMSHPSVNGSDLEEGLKHISLECSNAFIGYLVEVVALIDNLLGVGSSELLYIITGGVRTTMTVPLKCIGNELTSVFPNIMIADADISTHINLIVHGND